MIRAGAWPVPQPVQAFERMGLRLPLTLAMTFALVCAIATYMYLTRSMLA